MLIACKLILHHFVPFLKYRAYSLGNHLKVLSGGASMCFFKYKINAIHLLLGLLDSPLASPFELKLLDT